MIEKLTDWQWQIVSATLLGNGYLIAPKKAANFYLSISENKDENWLLYKSQELAGLAANNPFDETDSVWKWRSKSTPLLLDFHERHYQENKKIVSEKTLHRMRDIGLAVWFGDKGYWYSKKRIGLRTSYYGVPGNELIKTYFNEENMPCNITEVAPKRLHIVFSEAGTFEFLKIIGHRMHQFKYRLEP